MSIAPVVAVAGVIDIPLPAIQQGGLTQGVIHYDGQFTTKNILTCPISGNRYEFGRVVKESIFGCVYAAVSLKPFQGGEPNHYTYDDPPQLRAIKVYDRRRITEMQHRGSAENPVKELSALAYIKSNGGALAGFQHIVELHEIAMDDANVYSIMDFINGGELYDTVELDGALGESRSAPIFLQIVHGIQCLHALGITHRDLSLENVMQTSEGRCVIIDLGMSIRSSGPIPFQGICGKNNYMAPEVITRANPIQIAKCDIWALGICLFILVFGVPPVDSASATDPRFQMIARGMVGNMIEQWGLSASTQLLSLLNTILKVNPHERPSLEAILHHPWMRGERD